MPTRTEIRYAKSGDVHVAYQLVGDGPHDLVFVPGFVSNIEVQWEFPGFSHFIHRLASFSRLILFDKRGTGLSDRVPTRELPSLEERMDDVRAVMDAAGVAKATLFGWSEGGPMSILFAGTHPSRVDGLVLYSSYARRPVPPGGWESFLRTVEDRWGTGEIISARAQSSGGDERLRLLYAHVERQMASPGGAAAILRMAAEIDITGILPAVATPTLVLHRSGDPALPSSAGRDLAAGIPNGRFVELPGVDHIPWTGDGDDIAGEIEEFMTGMRHEPEGDRVLATVLFTDIVGSTELAAKLGDRQWRDLLDRHDELARHTVERFRGRVIKTTGDGLLATFDGPARGIRSACAVRDGLRTLGVEIRAGLHTGEIEVREEDIGGIAVHVAQRVAATSGSGEVIVSSTVKDLVAGAGIAFADRGHHSLKGIAEDWRLFAVVGED
jgi:class 3 adenylate cyclase/pimeloyl-ACP methyl ester carboxylesterase